MKRISSIDIVRGLVMVIMALDHVRDLMHTPSISQSPTDLETTTPVLFFTRWITHLCAPSFVFLAGTSVFLSLRKNNDLKFTRSFLLKRGVFLILLEFIVVNFALFFDPLYHTLLFEVIATIGLGFIILSLLLNLSATTIGIIGILIIFLHGLFLLIPPDEPSTLKRIFSFFFIPGAIPFSGRVFVMAYPPVPWLGIMLAGYGAGKLFQRDNRKALFLKMGAASLFLFIVLRFLNLYGDPSLFNTQKTGVYSFLSFMNISKYPPSLLFCLSTLGFMFILLAFAEGASNKLSRILLVYGRVPLFYFIIHFFLIHLLLLALLLMQGISPSQMEFASGTFGRPAGVASGVSLGLIYVIWLFVVVLLYFPCRWYGKYKASSSLAWLKYL